MRKKWKLLGGPVVISGVVGIITGVIVALIIRAILLAIIDDRLKEKTAALQTKAEMNRVEIIRTQEIIINQGMWPAGEPLPDWVNTPWTTNDGQEIGGDNEGE